MLSVPRIWRVFQRSVTFEGRTNAGLGLREFAESREFVFQVVHAGPPVLRQHLRNDQFCKPLSWNQVE